MLTYAQAVTYPALIVAARTAIVGARFPVFLNTGYIPRARKPADRSTGRNACQRCGGAGEIPQYAHVAHGVCFDCGGTGRAR